jgi:4-hydroxybenzoate polyprenyltransferase
MDIVDMDGDKKNGVNTLPNIFGREFAWNLTNNICLFAILTTSFSVAFLYDMRAAIYFFIIQTPVYFDMIHIQIHNYDKTIIKKYANRLIYPLAFTLAYLCLIARFK